MKTQFFPFLLLMFILQACGNDDHTPKWQIAQNTVFINFIGDAATLDIENARGEFDLYVENEEIAQAKMVDNQIIITAKKYGDTFLRVKDEKGNLVFISVIVTNKIQQFHISNSDVVVVGSDEAVCEEIRNELLPGLFEPGWRLQLKYIEADSGELEIIKRDVNSEKGTFETNFDVFRFTLEGAVHNFRVSTSVKPKSSMPEIVAYFIEDLTEAYQELYPDADIKEVRVIIQFTGW